MSLLFCRIAKAELSVHAMAARTHPPSDPHLLQAVSTPLVMQESSAAAQRLERRRRQNAECARRNRRQTKEKAYLMMRENELLKDTIAKLAARLDAIEAHINSIETNNTRNLSLCCLDGLLCSKSDLLLSSSLLCSNPCSLSDTASVCSPNSYDSSTESLHFGDPNNLSQPA